MSRSLALPIVLAAAALVASAGSAPLRAQAAAPGGGSLAAWLGIEPGDRFTYMTPDGEHVCVEAGRPLAVGDARWLPLIGMPWPTLATDSRIFLPLGATLGIGVIRTPTLRPAGAMDWLLEPLAPRALAREALAQPGGVPGDGWFAIGDPADPDALLYVWCAACMDAGRWVWLERGRGITRVEERTYAGPRRVTLLSTGCGEPDAR